MAYPSKDVAEVPSETRSVSSAISQANSLRERLMKIHAEVLTQADLLDGASAQAQGAEKAALKPVHSSRIDELTGILDDCHNRCAEIEAQFCRVIRRV